MTPLTAVHLGGDPELPLLVLGPSLGTTATAMWSDAAAHLVDHFHVLGWDLPGHGTNGFPVQGPTTMADLAAGVLVLVDAMDDDRRSRSFHYAGDSVGGAVGLQLLLDAPHRVDSATLLCTGARIGTAEGWEERIAAVRAGGTSGLVPGTAERWFAPGFVERAPRVGSTMLEELAQVDSEGYAAVCGALIDFDVLDRLNEISVPVLAVAGAHDVPTPPEVLRVIADGVRRGRLEVLEGVAHLAPVEDPVSVATLITEHAARSSRDASTVADVRSAGMSVRREVLGDAHVERSIERTTNLTRDFQQLITEYAWGSIWTRPGLDRRSRSLVTLTALVARGHHEELAMHLRAALRNGLSVEEIKEVLLQTAIYCGVPDANTAFRIAQEVLEES